MNGVRKEITTVIFLNPDRAGFFKSLQPMPPATITSTFDDSICMAGVVIAVVALFEVLVVACVVALFVANVVVPRSC